MLQFYSKWKLGMGLMSVVLLLVGGGIISEVSAMGKKSQAASPDIPPAWSQSLDSTNGDPTTGCNSDRFKCVLGGAAVLDMETGLVWEQSPVTTTHSLASADIGAPDNGADAECINRGVGGKMGWRLPSIPELASLVVPGDPAGGPDLPAGHPFSNIQSAAYWSGTRDVTSWPTRSWAADFSNGSVFVDNVQDFHHVWCVRGPSQESQY